MKLTDEQKSKIFETLGTASMAWSETPKGIFDSSLCTKIGNELVEFLESPQPSAPSVSAEEIEEFAAKDFPTPLNKSGDNITTPVGQNQKGWGKFLKAYRKGFHKATKLIAPNKALIGLNDIEKKAEEWADENYNRESDRVSSIAEFVEWDNRKHNFLSGAKWMQEYAQAQQGKVSIESDYNCVCANPTLGTSISRCGTCGNWFKPLPSPPNK